MELSTKNGNIIINSNKKEVEFIDSKIIIDNMTLDFPGEYEKSGILTHIIEVGDKLFFQVRLDDKNIAYIPYDNIELNEEILNLFGNIDILILLGSKNSIKIYENLEARCVVPYGEAKDVFFTTLGQHPEEVKNYKMKELSENEVTFVNLAN